MILTITIISSLINFGCRQSEKVDEPIPSARVDSILVNWQESHNESTKDLKDSSLTVNSNNEVVVYDSTVMNQLELLLKTMSGQSVETDGMTLNFIIWVNGAPVYRSNINYEPPVKGVKYTLEWHESDLSKTESSK